MTGMLKGKKPRTRLRQTWDDHLFDGLVYLFLGICSLLVAYPLVYIVAASFSSGPAVMSGAVRLWPVEPTLMAYTAAMRNPNIMIGYRNSLLYTSIGTALNMVMAMLAAFPLSRKKLYGRGFLNIFFIFTMFFSGGLIPSYLLVKDTLHIHNTVWAMILPGAMNVWFVILMRTYIQGAIPEELLESAELDGCGAFRLLWQMVVPLSGPIMAVVALYCAVGIWSNYFDAFIYLQDSKLYPLQVVLRSILIANNISPDMLVDAKEMAMRQALKNLLKYSLIVIASAPLLVMYPFVQKHFVKGIMIGSVKG